MVVINTYSTRWRNAIVFAPSYHNLFSSYMKQYLFNHLFPFPTYSKPRLFSPSDTSLVLITFLTHELPLKTTHFVLKTSNDWQGVSSTVRVLPSPTHARTQLSRPPALLSRRLTRSLSLSLLPLCNRGINCHCNPKCKCNIYRTSESGISRRCKQARPDYVATIDFDKNVELVMIMRDSTYPRWLFNA